MRLARSSTFGWGATLLLLSLSVLAALRLASIGAETLEAIADAPTRGGSVTGDIVALIEPATADYLATVLAPAFAAAREPGRYPFRIFSPGLPPFLAESTAMMETLDIAFEAGVAAIVVRPDRVRSLERAAEIASTGVLTVVLGTLIPEAATHVRVGADPTEYGALVARAIAPNLKPDTRVGYLCGLCSGAEAGPAQRFLEAVVSSPEFEGTGRSPATSSVVVQGVDDVELGSVAAARSLLLRGIDVVVCDTAEATIAMAQVVIDANLVGAVSIIGFGTADRVLALVDDRVVHATVSADYAGVAGEALEIVVDLLSGSVEHGIASPDRPIVVSPELLVVGPEARS